MIIRNHREEMQDELLATARQRDRALNQLEQIEDIVYRLSNEPPLVIAAVKIVLQRRRIEPDVQTDPDDYDNTLKQRLARLRDELHHVDVINCELQTKQARIAAEIDVLECELEAENEDEAEETAS